MKYAITHCYTDKNKGDAAIIISTTQLLRSIDGDAEINFYSTFGPNDKKFHEEHEYIKPYADNIFPGLFYQPEKFIFKKIDFLRGIPFIWIMVKGFLMLLSSNKFFLKLFLTDMESKGVREILKSDLIISKGGSYLTTQNTSIRQSLSLITMLFPFIFAKRHKKKIVIYSQSLGPVTGSFNKWIFHNILKNVNLICLRESFCKEIYPEVNDLYNKVDSIVIPDSAFYLKDEVNIKSPVTFSQRKFKVGMTLVDHAFKYIAKNSERQKKINLYKDSIYSCIVNCIEEYGAEIHLFPQVTVSNSHLGHNDVKIAKEIVERFSNTNYSDKVFFHDDDFTPHQLKKMYSIMDLFIGTRLHSVIFALSTHVPSINISYHGTKSQGILKQVLCMDEFVVDINTISEKILNEKVKKLYRERADIRIMLSKQIPFLQDQLLDSMNRVVDIARN